MCENVFVLYLQSVEVVPVPFTQLGLLHSLFDDILQRLCQGPANTHDMLGYLILGI